MSETGCGEITALLGKVRDGDLGAHDQLLPLVYRELEAIARGYVDGDASLEPCGLVHELYLRLATRSIAATSRKHFYATAALAMRQILADRARRRSAAKRGRDAAPVAPSMMVCGGRGLDAVSVDAALAKLEARSPRQARIVELRGLLGMSVAEVAEALAVSERTVAAEWRLARAWLGRELRAGIPS